jgi:aldehyde dehydrogenase (NAD+)
MGHTTTVEFEQAYSTLFNTFASGKTRDLKWRKWQLKQCWWMVEDNEDAIISAIHKDLHRPAYETYAVDLLAAKRDILDHIKNVEKWTADTPINAGLIFGTLGRARTHKEPLGVALIIGAWNFPFALIVQPLVAAIGAGCCAILKPSELASATEQLFADLVPKYLDQDAVRVVTGGSNEMSLILEHRFNVILFTGSNKVGKLVAAAAAKTLTPTVLELGGQNPTIVTKSADVDLAAKRVASSKYLNAGQICLTCNHVFVDPSIHDRFVERLAYWFEKFMNGSTDDFSRIINENHYKRLMKQLEATKGKVVYGGMNDESDKLVHPTVVVDVTMSGELPYH